MAQSHPELHLDAEGNLLDLHNKRTGKLLSPKEVAVCVKVIRIKGGDVDGEPNITFEPYLEEITGKNVNVIGGATGTGKTSLIYILAGGMQTEPKLQSDTKCPTIYIFEVNGSEVAILDTAGLCDTDAEANKVPEMQDLLVNAVAATIQRFRLKVVNFLICIEVGGRLPGKFCEVWPQMQSCLGGKKLGSFCHFVITKANADSKLEYSELGWPIISAGYENLAEIEEVLKTTSEAADGLGTEDVRPDVEGLEVKRKIANYLRNCLRELELKMKEGKLDAAQIFFEMKKVQAEIKNAYNKAASFGFCHGLIKNYLLKVIQGFETSEADLERKWQERQLTEDQVKADAEELHKRMVDKMEEIYEMEKLGNPFRSLAKIAGKKKKNKKSKL
eukprot:s2312_g6.t1